MTRVEARPPRLARRPRLALAALGLAALVAAAVALVPRDASRAGPPPRMADLWDGRAALVLDRRWTSAALGLPRSGAYAGAHVEIVGGTWYLFNRQPHPELACPGRTDGFTPLGTQVRASTDRGATWGPPTQILVPGPGAPWACAATDGDAVYDAAAGTWRYLFQCLGAGADARWSGCYAERAGPDPAGAFTPGGRTNPVIAPGRLWGRICDAGDRCAPAGRPLADEGTFSLLPDGAGAWWVGFHGWDGARGYRGLARTATFDRGGWEVDGAGGTPADAVLAADDAAGWREQWRPGGPIGAGAASLFAQDGRYYQLAEVADVDLACTAGQTWDLGLFRTRDLATARWEQPPAGNPLVYSSRTADAGGTSPPCPIAYPGLFADPATGTTYVMFGRSSPDPALDGIYVYRLEWDRNRLVNGDFARAGADGWHALPGTSAQLSVQRDPDGSADGTPYLALDCGAPACDGGQSVYQDIPVAAASGGGTVAFGGSFRAAAGEARLDVALQQLDGAGAVVASTRLPVTAGTRYAAVRDTVELDARTRRVRFELYPRTRGTIRADDLLVIPQDGCDEPRYPAC